MNAPPAVQELKAVCRNCHGGCGTIVRLENGVVTEVIGQVQAALKRASTETLVKDRLMALGGEPATSTPEEYTALIRSETQKFGKIVKDANIKAE